uniref:F-box domain-containing protein n=1 Tax=Davidia involucrata TaxID=16924 RepID=A0A5B7BPJ1_DAVIN
MATSKDQRNQQENQPLESRLSNLPQEIIVGILSRLAVKSLLQLKCVSKSWRSVISDPKFAITHHNRALQDKDVCRQRQRLLLSSRNLYSVQYKLPQDNVRTGVARELDSPFKYENPYDWVDIIGSCNGWVCIALDDTLFIYNPTTGESKKILNAPEILPARMNKYGYGYDPLNDDYKVVKLVFCGALVRVYSMKANSWKTIAELACHETVYENGVQLNGAIHWVVWRRKGKDYTSVIASFDLAQEIFTDIPVPVPEIGDTNTKFGVGVLDGCLCVMHDRYGEHNDFWVMKEYGVIESWTKFTLPNSYVSLKPLCLLKHDEALLQVNGKLVLYSLSDKTCKNLVICGVPFGVSFDADIYVESLLSPNHNN